MHSRMSFYMAALVALVFPCQAFSQDDTAAAQPDPIAQATDSVINTITSLSPQFQACYNGEVSVKDYIKLHFEYDENGEVYYIESSTDNKKLSYACYEKVIPKSFNSLLSHNFLEQRKLRTHNGFRHLWHEIIVENFV